MSPSKSSSFLSVKIIFISFLASRTISALYNQINDCDETYNYWEPAHFLLFGNDSFQTWEYSPRYAIRSYAYLWFIIWPGKILLTFGFTKIFIFYSIRFFLAFINTCIETFLVCSLQEIFNSNIAFYYTLISCFSSGMFVSSTSFLPSSFAIYTVAAGYGFWFRRQYRPFIFTVALSAIIGWPFTALIGAPMAIYLLISPANRAKFLLWSALSGAIIGIPTLIVDSFYFGRPVLASINIILYNVFSQNGPNLYGTESWFYYVINLFLNFNFTFLLTFMGSISIWALAYYRLKRTVGHQYFQNQFFVLASLHLWWLVFFLQPHKEERFMYPVYPLISMASAFTISNLENLIPFSIKNLRQLGFALFVILSLSRIMALYQGYHSSMSIYHCLWNIDLASHHNATICLGKEWHRFPSHFLVPPGFRVEFVPSEFRGQLPAHFDSKVQYPTRVIPAYMNDENREEPSRYVDVNARCHYLIDSNYSEIPGSRDIAYARNQEHWQKLHCQLFLDSGDSPRLYRAFYVPGIFEKRCRFVDYCLLKNRQIFESHH